MSKALEKNHKYLEDTIEMKTTLEGAYLVLAQRLAKIRDEELYRPEYDAFHQFLDEMNISESTASKMINIYKRFLVEYEIPKEKLLAAGGWSNVSEILPYAKDKTTAIALLDKMTGLMPGDKRRVIREMKTGIPSEKCKPHDWYHIKICRKCGERERTYEETE